MNFAQQVALLILSGGGAGAIFTLVKAFIALRRSTDTREATAIGNLEKWRIQADQRADTAYADLAFEREMSAFWQRRAAELEHVAIARGIRLPPLPPRPIRVATLAAPGKE